jgi:hypothetical protein
MPGSVTAAAGLFLVVFGFSHAETSGWANAVTLGSLAGAAVLLGAFVLIAQRTGHPLLPLRIVLNRNRGGAYSAIVMAAISIFGVFLFLTYYLQLTKGFSPVKTGLAFLPLVLFILIASISANVRLLPLVGARVLVTCGVLLGGLGMFYLTQITPSSG